MRLTLAILTAAEMNAEGAAKGESLKSRLRRSVEAAKRVPPVELGSFAQYADDEP